MTRIIKSRNETPRYSYFFVVSKNERTLSVLKFPEFKIYKFESTVTEARAKTQLKNSYTEEIRPLTDEDYAKKTFTHPNYRNQKNENIQFKYNELPVITVQVKDNKSIGLESTTPVNYQELIKKSKNEFFG